MTDLERDAEDQFVHWIESLGFAAWKLRIDGQDGFPDRAVVSDRGTVFFEFKRSDGRLRPRQIKVIGQLRKIGAPVFVVTSFGEAKGAFDGWYRHAAGNGGREENGKGFSD